MAAAGLYDPSFEHDACGVGFVADLSGHGGHDVVARALRVLCHLEHRGAKGGDPGTGDGAGILTQLPHDFFRAVCGFALPGPGSYAAGLVVIWAARRLALSGERTVMLAAACYAAGSVWVESVRIGPLPQVLGVRYGALSDVAVFGLAVAGLYLTRPGRIPPARTYVKAGPNALVDDSSGDVMSV